jgi:DNA primase
MSQLKEYQGKIVIAYDRDKAGVDGLKRFDMIRRQLRMSNHNLMYVQPKPPYKDWNEMLVSEPDSMLDYIRANTMFLDEITIALSSL